MMRPRPHRAFLEGRIRELENVLKHAVLIETDHKGGNKIALGNTVVIREVGTDYDEKYTLVGKMEADPSNGMISNESPMGSSLLNHKAGDEVLVKTPGGEISFEIVDIE